VQIDEQYNGHADEIQRAQRASNNENRRRPVFAAGIAVIMDGSGRLVAVGVR
jgi:hypothetical protein